MTRPDQPDAAVVLIVAWGQRYIERMARYGLASLLAPGNLPHVAARLPTTLRIMTRAEDANFVQAQRNIMNAKDFATVEIIPIDELIVPGLYTVTLTLAYARGIAASGEAMTRTAFFSLNADFVLSDGSLAHVLRCFDEGADCVMAASYKANAEDVLPSIEALVGHDTIVCSGRQLAAIGLAKPHLTTVAKTANQSRCWSRAANHIFWQSDDTACVARFLQIFFLGLRPTRVVTAVHGYCDYAFPELYGADGRMHIIADSDDVMILEMQDRAADSASVTYGARPAGVWEADISEWCVPSHLKAAQTPMLFHSHDRDAACEALIAQSEVEMKELLAGVTAPVPNRGHYYWVAGVSAWFQRRDAQAALPPELDVSLTLTDLRNPSFAPGRAARRFEARTIAGRGLRVMARRLRERLWGAPPRLGPLNIGRESYQPVLSALEALRTQLDAGDHVLVAAPVGTWLDSLFAPDEPGVTWIELDHLAFWTLQGDQKVDAALVMCQYPDSVDIQMLADHVRGVLKPGATLVYVAHKPIWLPDPKWMKSRLVDALLIESAMKPNLATIEIGRQPAGLDQRDLGRVAGAGILLLLVVRYAGLLALYGMRNLTQRGRKAEAEATSVVVRIIPNVGGKP